MSARRPSLHRLCAVVIVLIACLATARPVGGLTSPWTLDPHLIDALIEDVGESEPAGHLLVSEVMTGGASALDEFIEIYNPTDHELPLEGLEVVYVTASGATVSRRAAWSAGAPSVPSGGHVLVAHGSGIFAPIADVVYGSGLAAAGGSIALRIIGAASAIDAVGWGTAESSWMEGEAASAPAAGSSLERLPGGTFGSWQDSDDNAADFVVRSAPEPQNSSSPLTPASVPPSPSPSPSPSHSPPPSTPTPSPSSSPGPLSIGAARLQPNGSSVTVAGVSLTDSDFGEGGGYLADAQAGIAILLSSGEFSRGSSLVVTGQIDDRYHQRTIRASTTGIVLVGSGPEPPSVEVAIGSIGELHEGRLVRIRGTILAAPTSLVAGLAYDLSDGSGAVRVLVSPQNGIDTSGWAKGTQLELVGVVGQRDSTGGGTAGYRVQPRDDDDIHAVLAPSPTPGPSASPTASGHPTPTPTGDPGVGVVSIATARSLTSGTAAHVRGVVTAPTGLVGPGSVILQDATGAILLRHADEIGPFGRGELVEIQGTRATLSGMLSLRVNRPALRLGSQAEPAPVRLASGGLGEAHEARLVVVRGALTAAPRRSSANNVFLSIDDGSGAAAVAVLASSQISVAGMVRGAWIEVQGVLGQETSGSQPDRGYRIWPRDQADLRIIAAPTTGGSTTTVSTGGGSGVGTAAGLGMLDPGVEASAHDLGPLLHGEAAEVRATLVIGEWPELDLAGLLWDGDRLAGVPAGQDAIEQVRAALALRRPPLAVAVRGRAVAGSAAELQIDIVELEGPQALTRADGPPSPPRWTMPTGDTPAWVRLVGAVEGGVLRAAADATLEVEVLCGDRTRLSGLDAMPLLIEGIGIGGSSPRLLVPCGGLQALPALAAAAPLATPHDRPSPSPRPVAGEELDAASRDATPGLLALLIGAALSLAALVGVAVRTGGLARIVAEGRRRLGGESRSPAALETDGRMPPAAETELSPLLSVLPSAVESGPPGRRTSGGAP